MAGSAASTAPSGRAGRSRSAANTMIPTSSAMAIARSATMPRHPPASSASAHSA